MDQTENITFTPQPEAKEIPKVQTPPVEVKSKPNGGLIVFLVVLVLALVGFVGYMFFTDRLDIGIENPFSKKENVVEEDSNTEEDSNKEECEECEETYTLKNAGWALFDLRAYEFSAEIPSYTMDQKVEDSTVTSLWKVGYFKDTLKSTTYYSNYLSTVFVKFIPDDVSMFACGEGCVKEHILSVEVFENKGSKTLNDVKTTYIQNWKKDMTGILITEKQEKKWGHDVVSFDGELEMGGFVGSILVTNKFVYVVHYSMSADPASSLQIAQKVLDSFEFGK